MVKVAIILMLIVLWMIQSSSDNKSDNQKTYKTKEEQIFPIIKLSLHMQKHMKNW